MSEFGAVIKQLRNEKGWSQGQLAVYSDTSQPTVNQIETGKRNPSTETLAKLARALEVEVADLFPLEQPRLPDLPPPGEAFFVPLEDGEEEDKITLRVYYVRLVEEGEPILKAMREASPEEAATMRQQREKAGQAHE